jgi:hypothetical protein
MKVVAGTEQLRIGQFRIDARTEPLINAGAVTAGNAPLITTTGT